MGASTRATNNNSEQQPASQAQLLKHNDSYKSSAANSDSKHQVKATLFEISKQNAGEFRMALGADQRRITDQCNKLLGGVQCDTTSGTVWLDQNNRIIGQKSDNGYLQFFWTGDEIKTAKINGHLYTKNDSGTFNIDGPSKVIATNPDGYSVSIKDAGTNAKALSQQSLKARALKKKDLEKASYKTGGLQDQPLKREALPGPTENKDLSPESSTQALTSEQQQAVKNFETQMQRFLPYFLTAKADGSPDQAAISTAKKQLLDDNGQFGQEARTLYAKFVDWMQNQNGPNTMRLLEQKGLPFPPGGPDFKADSIKQEDQAVLSADALKRLAGASDLKMDLHVDPAKVPDKKEYDSLDAAVRWMSAAQTIMKTEDQKVIDGAMLQDVRSFGFAPFTNAFQPPLDTADPKKIEQWRSNTQIALDLMHETRRYAEATIALRDAGYYGKLNIPLPPGVSEDVKTPGRLIIHMPTDQHMDSPNNQNRLRAFEQWKQQYGEGIDSALVRVEFARLTPDKTLSWGDIELTGMQVVLKNGEFKSLAKTGTYTPQTGEELKNATLMENRFDVHTDANGNIVVNQTVQPQTAWGYQNMFGINDVGRPYKSGDIVFKPSDFVPVTTSAGTKLVQARDLQSFKLSQAFEHYGEKALIGAMDALTIASATTGSGEVLAGLREATLVGGKLALKDGTEITSRQLAVQAAKLGLKLTVGATGIFTNADAESTSWGSTINKLRGYYFLTDIAISPTKAATLLNPTETAQRFLQEQFAKSSWVSTVDTWTNRGFKMTEYGYAPQIVKANFQALHRVFGQHENDSLADAYKFLIDKRGLGRAEPGDFDVRKADALKGTIDLLTNYETTLAKESGGAAKPEVMNILERTKEVLRQQSRGEVQAVENKKALIDQLIAQESFHGNEVQALNQFAQDMQDANRGNDAAKPLSGQQLSQLYAGKQVDGFSPDASEALRQIGEKIMATRDPDVEAAQRIALLYLTRDENGKLKESLGSAQAELPLRHKANEAGQSYYKTMVSVDTDSLVTRLRSELAVPTDAQDKVISARALAVGDLLTRVGAISNHKYADALGLVLESPNVSRTQKIQALLGGQGVDYSTLVLGVRAEERAQMQSPESSTAEQLQHHLDALAARTTEDKDVRALAAMLSFGLAPENVRALPAIVNAARNSLNSSGEFDPGVISNSAIGYLKTILAKPIDPGNSTFQLNGRFEAAKTLALLGTDDPELKSIAAASMACNSEEGQTAALTALVKHSRGQSLLDVLRDTNQDKYRGVIASYVSATEEATKRAAAGDTGALEKTEQLLAASQCYFALLSTEQRSELVQSLSKSYLKARLDTGDTQIATKALLLNAVSILDPQAATPILVAASGVNSDGAKEQSAQIRQLALSKLNQNNYEGMKDLASKLLTSEQDPAVRKTLTDLVYAYQQPEDVSRQTVDSMGKDNKEPSLEAALQAATGEAQAILQKTKTILSLEAKGDPTATQAKAQFLQVLTKHELFSSDDINQMNYFLRNNADPTGRMPGRALSAQDVTDLYEGKIPSWVTGDRGVHLQQIAESILAKRNPEEEEARRLSILYLARGTNGEFQPVASTTQITFPLPALPGNSFSSNSSYTQTVSITTSGLIKRLQADLSTTTELAQAEKPLLDKLLSSEHSADTSALTPDQIAWLHDRFPYLLSADYTAAVQQAGDNSMSRLERLITASSTVDGKGMQAIAEVARERQQEWDKLKEYAKNTYGSEAISQEDSANARAVLFSILSHDGKPMSTDGNIIQWRNHKVADANDPLYNSATYWQNRAAEALSEASQPGVLGRNQIEDFFKKALADGNNLTPESRLALLKAWSKYYSPMNQLNGAPASGTSFISMSEYTKTLSAAYQAEADRQRRGLGSSAYMAELEKAIKALPGNLAFSIFPALTTSQT